jgi:hypothetical protein
MKLLLTLFALLVVAIGTGYGSLASSYQMDVAQFGGRQLDGGWVWVASGNGTHILYKVDGGVVEAAVCYLPMGNYFPEWLVWAVLPKVSDRAGQNWVHYDNDAYGNPEYVTNDSRLYAKTFWLGGYHVLRICYAQFLTSNGLMRFPHTAHAKAKAKSKPQHHELLPPVEEAEVN